MLDEGNKKEPYCVSISDWIAILQYKTSASTTYIVFLTTTILAAIIAIPQLIKESTLGSSVVTVVVIVFLYLIFIYYFNMNKKESKPYRELYNKIIKGHITDPRIVLEEYNKIESKLKIKGAKT